MNDEAGDIVDMSLDRVTKLMGWILRNSGGRCAAISHANECLELVDTLKKLYPRLEEPVASIGTITVDIANTESVVKIMNATKTMLLKLEALQLMWEATRTNLAPPETQLAAYENAHYECSQVLTNITTTFKAEVFHEWAAIAGAGGE